jgi:hypothetical protein
MTCIDTECGKYPEQPDKNNIPLKSALSKAS